MFSKQRSPSINLIPQDPFFDTVLGRTLSWCMGAGRYIVIFTEIVVILSFAARFTLDRTVTDLNESLLKQLTLIEGMREDELAFKLAQSQVTEVKTSLESSNIIDVFGALNKVVPPDILLKRMSISQKSVSLEADAQSQNALITFINNLQLSNQFNSVRVGKIETSEDNPAGLTFTVMASTRLDPVVTKRKTTDSTTKKDASEEKED